MALRRTRTDMCLCLCVWRVCVLNDNVVPGPIETGLEPERASDIAEEKWQVLPARLV